MNHPQGHELGCLLCILERFDFSRGIRRADFGRGIEKDFWLPRTWLDVAHTDLDLKIRITRAILPFGILQWIGSIGTLIQSIVIVYIVVVVALGFACIEAETSIARMIIASSRGTASQ